MHGFRFVISNRKYHTSDSDNYRKHQFLLR